MPQSTVKKAQAKRGLQVITSITSALAHKEGVITHLAFIVLHQLKE
jgi:hypothetical protein